MKKIKLEGKLNLNKETVTKLNDAQMKNLNGGAWFTLYHCNKTRNCATATCPTVGCPTGSCPNVCVPHTEGGSICQSGCGDMQCP
ncbi:MULTISPECIES: class I lanthipeptide [Flavobacterium]|uniref:Class I lanthipeptide n=1 Tax=Flavobacterium jumunjinense TaxID=998845 RepID=A0ABV5GM27_9FLAO|nr:MULTISPECIES: class I lanthipeptide [Flavobacterium]